MEGLGAEVVSGLGEQAEMKAGLTLKSISTRPRTKNNQDVLYGMISTLRWTTKDFEQTGGRDRLTVYLLDPAEQPVDIVLLAHIPSNDQRQIILLLALSTLSLIPRLSTHLSGLFQFFLPSTRKTYLPLVSPGKGDGGCTADT